MGTSQLLSFSFTPGKRYIDVYITGTSANWKGYNSYIMQFSTGYNYYKYRYCYITIPKYYDYSTKKTVYAYNLYKYHYELYDATVHYATYVSGLPLYSSWSTKEYYEYTPAEYFYSAYQLIPEYYNYIPEIAYTTLQYRYNELG